MLRTRTAGSLTRLALLSGLFCLALVLPASAGYSPDPSTPRADVPAEYQWQATHIFPDNAAWEKELELFSGDLGQLTAFQGRLGESAETLLEADRVFTEMRYRLYSLILYTQTLYDVDQGDDLHRQMRGRVTALYPAYGEATAWVEPELLEIDPAVIKGWMAENEDLRVFEYSFSELWRQQAHTLSAPEERIMALSGNMRRVPGEAHEALLGVDMEFPELVNAEGELIPLTVSGFSSLRASEVYNVRKQAADAFFSTLRKHENTLALLLDGAVKSHILTKNARGYDSCLEGALSPDNIAPEAYRMLVATVRENLPRTMHKYVSLRRKVLGLEGPLTFPNLYNAMIKGIEPEYSYDEGRQIITTALKPLGTEYGQILEVGLDPANGWIDVYPNEDKSTGAYSNGMLARSIHPYVLHNFDNTLDAVSTTAHELGHALHSHFSSQNQPPIYEDYTTFLAEVASTANEALLTNYLLDVEKDTDMQLMLLNQRLESIRLTIFRQTLFADFELRFHEYAEAGNPLTAEFLNKLYGEMIKEYYGAEFELGPDDECEWMFIPHFYYNFYVFTYATGLTSGLAIADAISEGGDPAATRYIDNLLKAGGSAPPLDILHNAGVDLQTPAPIVKTMDLFEKTVDEFDRIWQEKYGQ